MRLLALAGLAAAAVAGCAAQGPAPRDPAPATAGDVGAACAAAVAAHVGRPAAEVAVLEAGPAVVTVRDGTRVHRCDLRDGRVAAIVHPGAEG